ncbi:MAG TPA: hypothetical protein VFK05_39360, partial [Polyangiaceae bacterium]|nr:hypothetical protein [Polyangiaceae bacterium]
MKLRAVSAVLFASSWLSLSSCHRAASESASAESPGRSAAHPGEVRSNILRTDYAGSQICAGCHERQAAAWFDSPMHRMTRSLSS